MEPIRHYSGNLRRQEAFEFQCYILFRDRVSRWCGLLQVMTIFSIPLSVDPKTVFCV